MNRPAVAAAAPAAAAPPALPPTPPPLAQPDLPLGGFVPVDPGFTPAPPVPKRGISAVVVVLIVVGGLVGLIVLSAVVFVLVSNLGAEGSPEGALLDSGQSAWVEDTGATVAAGLVLYSDEFSEANDNIQRDRYSQAQENFQAMRTTADQVDSDLLVQCYDNDAMPRCEEMRDHWQELSYVAQKGWGCAYNLENDYYGDDDCDDAIAAMDGLSVRLEAIGDILTEWGYLE